MMKIDAKVCLRSWNRKPRIFAASRVFKKQRLTVFRASSKTTPLRFGPRFKSASLNCGAIGLQQTRHAPAL
jgi:hypothetical protein